VVWCGVVCWGLGCVCACGFLSDVCCVLCVVCCVLCVLCYVLCVVVVCCCVFRVMCCVMSVVMLYVVCCVFCVVCCVLCVLCCALCVVSYDNYVAPSVVFQKQFLLLSARPFRRCGRFLNIQSTSTTPSAPVALVERSRTLFAIEMNFPPRSIFANFLDYLR